MKEKTDFQNKFSFSFRVELVQDTGLPTKIGSEMGTKVNKELTEFVSQEKWLEIIVLVNYIHSTPKLP